MLDAIYIVILLCYWLGLFLVMDMVGNEGRAALIRLFILFLSMTVLYFVYKTAFLVINGFFFSCVAFDEYKKYNMRRQSTRKAVEN
jgi:hypothetical protein